MSSPPVDSGRVHDCVHVELGRRSYDVLIGQGLLDDAGHLAALHLCGTAMLVSNTVVHSLFGKRTTRMLERVYSRVFTVVLPDGESHKTWSSLDLIFSALLEHACDRDTTLVALGGGVVGDITGFAAASYMRGIPYIQLPTTLLAQVDSSVGGKTAINHPLGKNMIGAFHQPLLVIADIETLRSLPEREYRAGLAEVIKYGAIADVGFFAWLEGNADALLAREPVAIAKAVHRSCEIKADVVRQDEHESGIRATLNFGHTTAHAIETGAGYGAWLHGEAVACGMVVAAALSVDRGALAAADATRLVRLIDRIGLPIQTPPLGRRRYLELMHRDKKAQAGAMRFILLDAIGRAVVATVDDASAVRAIEACASSETPS